MSEVVSTLGIDTSNYTTSAAIVHEDLSFQSSKKLLSVKDGELGLRQSDAVFAHVKQFPEIIGKLDFSSEKICAVGVSSRPRSVEGSYMPCFMLGVSVAETLAKTLSVPLYEFSHQQGHIAAAILSSKKEELFNEPFLCFHASGGTTELLRVDGINNISIVSHTTDISVGQLIDRTGVMLGFGFPAGASVEKCAENGELPENVRIKLKDGCCALSGYENKVATMIKNGVEPKNISYYIQTVIAETVSKMIEENNTDNLPVLCVGGVMSNSAIKKRLDNGNTFFAEPYLSSDNAVGIAYLTMKMYKGELVE